MGVLEVITLIATVFPRLLAVGMSAADAWASVNKVINQDGTVNEEEVELLKQRSDTALAIIERRAREAEQG